MSVLTRCALPLVVIVAAFVLYLSPGSALAATEDISANPGESAQGKPDDWGAPQGRPDDWGIHQDGSSDEIPGTPAGDFLARSIDGEAHPRLLGRPDDFGQGVATDLALRLVEILDQLRFRTRK